MISRGQKWVADNDLGLSCRWIRGVITFEEFKVEDDSTESERGLRL